MSDKSSAVVVPADSKGSLQPAQAAAVTSLKGGAVAVTAMPLTGGRKTKKVPKKILKLFKKGSAKKLRKMMKGGEEAMEEVVADGSVGTPDEGAGRRRKSRKTRRGSRKSRRGHAFLY